MPIAFEKVSYTYAPGTPFAYAALKEVDLAIEMGKITAIIGPTGSGKSTLVQHLNALLQPSDGQVLVLDRIITHADKPKQLKSLRKNVGLVFQFPEYQLFEETVLKDVMFGPLNFGVSEEEAKKRAMETLLVVGIDPSIAEKSPLDLSGGQKRRIAIAGILAIDPKVLVLDEPTAGLDPQGSKSMMQLFTQLNRQYEKTVLIVTHDMEHVLNYCDNVVVMQDGKCVTHQTVKEFFNDGKLLHELNIKVPNVLRFKESLAKGGLSLPEGISDLQTLAKAIAGRIKP
ncbi:MAG: energy-coupling factor transporter ATPase [Erysipelotrichaceae bacterium]